MTRFSYREDTWDLARPMAFFTREVAHGDDRSIAMAFGAYGAEDNAGAVTRST